MDDADGEIGAILLFRKEIALDSDGVASSVIVPKVGKGFQVAQAIRHILATNFRHGKAPRSINIQLYSIAKSFNGQLQPFLLMDWFIPYFSHKALVDSC